MHSQHLLPWSNLSQKWMLWIWVTCDHVVTMMIPFTEGARIIFITQHWLEYFCCRFVNKNGRCCWRGFCAYGEIMEQIMFVRICSLIFYSQYLYQRWAKQCMAHRCVALYEEILSLVSELSKGIEFFQCPGCFCLFYGRCQFCDPWLRKIYTLSVNFHVHMLLGSYYSIYNVHLFLLITWLFLISHYILLICLKLPLVFCDFPFTCVLFFIMLV